MMYNELNEILQSYFESPDKSAILLHGEWGSGKTFYVRSVAKSFLENRNSDPKTQQPSVTVVYCSLNGLKNADDFFQRLAVAVTLAKYGSSKISNSKIGDFLSRFSKDMSKIPVVGKYIPLGMLSFITQWVLENVKNSILFLDDLERVKADFRLELIGTIHSLFVEDKGMRVVYLCDEDKIKDSEYAEAKEKYISRTFRFQSDIAFIYDKYLLTPDGGLKYSVDLLKAKRDFILKELSDLKIQNIRTLFFIIHQIEKMIGLTKQAESFLSENSFLSSLISTSLLYKDGVLKNSSDLERITRQYYQNLMVRHVQKPTENTPKKEFEVLQEKYGRDILVRTVSPPVQKIIFEGYISKEELEQHIQKLTGADRSLHERAFEDIRHFRTMQDEESLSNLVVLIKSAKKGKYSPLEYLHLAHLCEWFKQLGILKGVGINTALTKGLELSLENDMQEIEHEPEAYIDADRYSFVSSSELATEFKTKILASWEIKYANWHQKVAEELLLRLLSGYKALLFSREGFKGAPFFSEHTTKVYSSALPSLATAQIYNLGNLIEDRYLRIANAGEHYFEAIPYLEDFRKTTTNEKEKSLRFRRAALQSLEETLNKSIAHIQATRKSQN